MMRTGGVSRRAARVLFVVAAAMVACLGALALTDASAAALDVTARKATVGTAARCASSATVATAATSGAQTTGVTITGLQSQEVTGCVGQTATLRLVDANGTELAVRTGLAVASSIVVSGLDVATSQVKAALIDIDGFALPTSWKVDAPAGDFCEMVDAAGNVSSEYTCKVALNASPEWYVGSSGQVEQYQVQWSFSAWKGASQAWNTGLFVRFRLSAPTTGQPSYWVWSTAAVVSSTNPAVTLSSTCSSLPVVAGTLTSTDSAYLHLVVMQNASAGDKLCTS